MARQSQEELKAMQLEMMTRYPHPQQPVPVPSYNALGGQSGYAASAESSHEAGSLPQGHGEPYYVGPAQRRLETGYTWAKERQYHKNKDKHTSRRHFGERCRDCMLLLVVVLLFALLVVWAINQGYFGGGGKKYQDSDTEPSLVNHLSSGKNGVKGQEIILSVVRGRKQSETQTTSKLEDISTEQPSPSEPPTSPEPPIPPTSEETMPTTTKRPGHRGRDGADSPIGRSPMDAGQLLSPPPGEPPTPGDKVRLIVDVDPGVDDAMALSLALTSKRASLEAITVVAGNTLLENAYSNALRVMKVIGREDVPVYKGADRPITGLWEPESTFFGPDNFGGASAKYQPADVKETGKLAHIAIRDMIRERPKELTVVLLGPLTNMAIAMLMEPNLTDDIAHIFILGGNREGSGNAKEGAEFNFYSDPVSARVVLQRATCPVTIVTWETLEHDALPWDVYDELTSKNTTRGKFLLDITNHTAHCCTAPNGPGFALGDFLAMLAALYPESVNATLRARVDVELHGSYTMGQVVLAGQPHLLPHVKRKVTIIDSFHIEKAVEVFREVFDVDG